ncbi:hypothetical protein NITHO_2000011 [Nitrolancea hollandica Lb]|uniref:Uncharacterized protein n=1 Tax=Nitrolancea hollandica Lb TaxID=1129897 RepID=I4EET8_9BACT|nr:hypothetical protein NITHO_2000011 [Nitrolancea hollandica Lb]
MDRVKHSAIKSTLSIRETVRLSMVFVSRASLSLGQPGVLGTAGAFLHRSGAECVCEGSLNLLAV